LARRRGQGLVRRVSARGPEGGGRLTVDDADKSGSTRRQPTGCRLVHVDRALLTTYPQGALTR
jgi:hypothetical protein